MAPREHPDTARRPTVVAFDVNETLFSLEPLRPRLEAVGLPGAALEWWFAQVLRDGFGLSVAGDPRPFRTVAGYGLSSLAARQGLAVGDTWVEDVLDAIGSLPAHPDAAPALRRLAGAGVRVWALTNGSGDTTDRLLRHAGLDAAVERVVSVEEVGRWKPHPAPYRHAVRLAGVEPPELALVAVHGWDVMGAARAGLLTGWASRLERTLAPWVPPPTVAGETLVDVADRLLALPAA